MADFKRRTLYLNSGKQIRLYGSSLAIGPSLEIGEGSAPNIFSFIQEQNDSVKEEAKTSTSTDLKKKNSTVTVLNPNSLSKEDLMEIADYNIQLWMNLKDSLRKNGISNPKVFNSEALR